MQHINKQKTKMKKFKKPKKRVKFKKSIAKKI